MRSPPYAPTPTPDIEDDADAMQRLRRHWPWVLFGIVGVLTVTQMAGVSRHRADLETAAIMNAGAASSNASSVRQVGAALAALCRAAAADAIRDAGLTSECRAARDERVEDVAPIATPSPVPGPLGPIGPAGPQGPPPSREAVAAAVAAYCADRDACQGPAGPAGHDAEPLTPEQVAEAVAAYCTARGECRGPAGRDGERGPQGDPPTRDQVAVAVAAYCATGACRGEPGEAGPAGPAGPPRSSR